MKKSPVLLLTALLACPSGYCQQTWKGLPLIKSHADRVRYQVNDQRFDNQWRITPQVADDSLHVKAYSITERIRFSFITDTDSISFPLPDGKSRSFYVLLGDSAYALTTIDRRTVPIGQVRYSQAKANPEYRILYGTESRYLDSLRRLYPVPDASGRKGIDKVLAILDWVHDQWQHDGGQSPSAPDAISILNEVKRGGRFPCFAYAIVLAAQLKAAGFPTRVLYLKTKDIETSKYAGGHVATEVYLPDLKKWVFVDGQFNVMPSLKGRPLNAVEFREALAGHYDELELRSVDQVCKRDYIDFVLDYLYFYDCAFDQRPAATTRQVNGKSNLMLVPEGVKNPEFMMSYDARIDYCIYTHSLSDFYAPPR